MCYFYLQDPRVWNLAWSTSRSSFVKANQWTNKCIFTLAALLMCPHLKIYWPQSWSALLKWTLRNQKITNYFFNFISSVKKLTLAKALLQTASYAWQLREIYNVSSCVKSHTLSFGLLKFWNQFSHQLISFCLVFFSSSAKDINFLI